VPVNTSGAGELLILGQQGRVGFKGGNRDVDHTVLQMRGKYRQKGRF